VRDLWIVGEIGLPLPASESLVRFADLDQLPFAFDARDFVHDHFGSDAITDFTFSLELLSGPSG
jgi:hypothetical protein